MLALSSACGAAGGGGTAQTATARVNDANDAATVTAVAIGGTNPGGGALRFATLAPGSADGSPTVSTARSGSAPAGTPAGVAGNTYADPRARFTLTIPPGWRVQASSAAGVDFKASPATLRGAFQLADEDVGTGVSIDDYATGTMANFRSTITNYQPLQGGVQQTTIGGMAARRFDFTGQSGSTDLRAAVLVVEQGTTAYTFLIAADPADFDAVYAQAKQFIDSFIFLG